MHALKPQSKFWRIDPLLLTVVLVLLILGLTMVTSASIVVAEKRTGNPFYYTWHHLAYLMAGGLGAMTVFAVPAKSWQKIAPYLLGLTVVLLTLVLVPGIGKVVNGSARWISLGPVTFQPSEIAKFSVILYISSFLVRRHELVTTKITGFIMPMGILGVLSVLLLLEPDFGSVVVMGSTTLCMLFLAGVPLRYFIGLVSLAGLAFGFLAISQPYRLERLTSFLDPWAYQFDSGYQLTQALIAFGRGEWFGVGLGSSVQKLFYLPESHTDFVFAVLGEELGLMGTLMVVILFSVFILRGIKIAHLAEKREAFFSAFVAYGITFWIGLQALINIGVNTGVLPTKGLTLPFLSYGGNSLVIICMAVSLVFRIDYENRLAGTKGPSS